MTIEVSGVHKSFGGKVVLDDLTFETPTASVVALIGPNGAGKTTVFNLLTGFLEPDRGSIHLDGRSLARVTTSAIVARGMIRSFQRVRMFPELTCLENVMLGCQGSPGESWFRSLVSISAVRRAERADRTAALAYLEQVGLAQRADHLVGELAYPEVKLVSLAQLLASGASHLLLDEPAAGLDASSVRLMEGVIRDLKGSGRTILIVEHNMQFVRSMECRVLFLHEGAIVADGSFADVTSDSSLSEIYFGTS